MDIINRYPGLNAAINQFAERIQDERIRRMFVQCALNTLTTTLQETDNDVYLITGDIDAMWLRDSTAQVMHYLELAPDSPDVKKLIKGVIRRQCYYITCDPYANAFNFEANGNGHREDVDAQAPIVFERKFELDSLCYPLFLSERYARYTGDKTLFDEEFFKAAECILTTFETERYHTEKSPYVHYRPTRDPRFSLTNRGHGDKTVYTGMVWEGYRPSDDVCRYNYNIPGNMFVAVTMDMLAKIAAEAGKDELARRAKDIEKTVREGIEKYGIVEHGTYGKIYAYETDGRGNYFLMDDANIPNLLGLPYIGWCDENDVLYQNTRRFVLSEENPFYFEGKYLNGVGSPHTKWQYVWPISVIMEGLTTDNRARINEIVTMLVNTTDGTLYMHESVNPDDPSEYSRPWFAWANSLFSYFLIKKADAIDCIR